MLVGACSEGNSVEPLGLIGELARKDASSLDEVWSAESDGSMRAMVGATRVDFDTDGDASGLD